MVDFGLESELFVPATSAEVIRLCREIAQSLDLVVIDKPRRRLVLRGQYPEQDVRIDVEVSEENGGTRVFLNLERNPMLRWAELLERGYRGLLFARVREELELALAGRREEEPLTAGAAEWRGLRSLPVLVKPIRMVAVYCMLLGVGLAAVAVFTWPRPGATYAVAAVWLEAASFCLQTVRRRMLNLSSQGGYLFAAGWVVVVAVATVVYLLWR